jgi:hypothetical protein
MTTACGAVPQAVNGWRDPWLAEGKRLLALAKAVTKHGDRGDVERWFQAARRGQAEQEMIRFGSAAFLE